MIRIWFLVLSILLCKDTFCQRIETFIPPSADAGSLGKYANWIRTKNTGSLEKSIPIYEVEAGQLRIPITLDYVSGNGVRVEDKSSWVGLGWIINAGGAIIREIKGEDDLRSSGFLNSRVPTEQEIISPGSGYRDFPEKVIFQGWDSESDIYNYILPTKSGKFFFKNQGEAVLVEDEKIKVNYHSGGNDFTVIDENGNYYIFGAVEWVNKVVNSAPPSADDIPIGVYSNWDVTWYLTQIISADKVDTVNFNYSWGTTTQFDNKYSFTQSYGTEFDQPTFKNLSNIEMTQTVISYVPLLLESISYKNLKVRFNTVEDRLDGGGRRLSSIEVLNEIEHPDKKMIKKIDFKTSYFYSTIQNPHLTFQNPERHRLKLDSVQFLKNDHFVENSYAFEYSTIELPPRNNYAQDYWGFYNGATSNQSLLRKIREITLEDGVMTIGNADRSVNPNYLEAGILKKIIYPTKGYSTFEYGANKYNGVFTELVSNRYSTFASAMNMTDIYRFKGGGQGGARITFELRKIGDLTGLSDRPYVILKNLTTNTNIFVVRAEASYDVVKEFPVYFELDHEYELFSTIPTTNPATPAYAGANIDFYEYRTVNSLKDGYGLRVEKISNFDKLNSLTGTTTYKYGVSESGNGILLSDLFLRFPFEHVQKYEFGIGEVDEFGIRCVTRNKERKIYYDSSPYATTYFSGSALLYEQIAEYQSSITSNPTENGKKVSKYLVEVDESLPVVSGYLSTVFQIPKSWKNGKVLSESYFKKQNGGYKMVREVANEYIDKEIITSGNLKVGRKVISTGCRVSPVPLYQVFFFNYPMYSGVRLLSKQKEVYYDEIGENPISTQTKEYKYNENNQVNRLIELQSDNYEKITDIKFTVDMMNDEPSNPVTQQMVSRNMLNSVFETKTSKNGNVGHHIRALYKDFNGCIIAPEVIEELDVLRNIWLTKIKYLGYNRLGQPASYFYRGGYETILWGYGGQYPVAKIENATYAEVLTALGGGTIATNKLNLLNAFNVSPETINTTIGSLRISMLNSQVSSYTYEPLVGMKSMTDPRGIKTEYTYDGFQRLKNILDFEGNILKNYKYHYRP